MSKTIKGISSMAMKDIVGDLSAQWQREAMVEVAFESVGGVDAARRIANGEPLDVVVLASDAIDTLMSSGHLLEGSKLDLARSGVAVAVRRGAPHPDIASPQAFLATIAAARTVGYSTGPSGVELVKLLDRLGLSQLMADKLVRAEPGQPVGGLVARGEVEIGIQQLSELVHVAGVDVVGSLPAEYQIVTTFSAAVCVASVQPSLAGELVRYFQSGEGDAIKRRHGTLPA